MNERDMIDYILSQWLSADSAAVEKSRDWVYNKDIALLRLAGEGVFRAVEMSEPQPHHSALLLLSGEVSFLHNEQSLVITAPAYVDFILLHHCDRMRTDAAFEAFLLAVDGDFFRHATEHVCPLFNSRIYRYANRSFTALTADELDYLLAIVRILSASISRKEHFFRHEVQANMLRSLLIEVWSTVFRSMEENGEGADSYGWSDILAKFFYLVRVNCRVHHDVRWYAEQLCVSSDALSSKLRRMCDKPAGRLIDECLIGEARTALLNPLNSIQDMSTYSVSSIRLPSAASSNGVAECRPASSGNSRKRKDSWHCGATDSPPRAAWQEAHCPCTRGALQIYFPRQGKFFPLSVLSLQVPSGGTDLSRGERMC